MHVDFHALHGRGSVVTGRAELTDGQVTFVGLSDRMVEDLTSNGARDDRGNRVLPAEGERFLRALQYEYCGAHFWATGAKESSEHLVEESKGMSIPEVLYTSGAVHKRIKQLLSNPNAGDRRVVAVAYVGFDAPSYLPHPKGLEVVCNPTLGTSHVALKQLITRGADVRVSDRLHMKVYWSKRRGCVITSANVSKNALGASGLKEAGVFLPSGAVDIDRVLVAASPRTLTDRDLTDLAKAERRAVARGVARRQPPKAVTFQDWYTSIREQSWKVAWYDSDKDVSFSKAAKSRANQEYGIKEPAELMYGAKGQLAEDDWLLCVLLGKKTVEKMGWMFVTFVTKVNPSESSVYDPSYPFQAIQVHALSKYPDPPFKLTPDVRSAIRKVLQVDGLDRLRKRRSLMPTESFLHRVSQELRVVASR